MAPSILTHMRRNAIAYLALFFAFTGSAYALATGEVKTRHLANNAVKAPKIAGGAVKAPKIANGAVGAVKIANNAVDGARVADGSLTGADIDSSTTTQPIEGLAYVTGENDIAAGSTGGVGAQCPAGKVPIGGGFSSPVTGVNPIQSTPADDGPPFDGKPDSWIARFNNTTGASATAAVYAICAPAKNVTGDTGF